MTNSAQHRNRIFPSFRPATAALAIAFALLTVITQSAQAQTLAVLHAFTERQDGANPTAGLTMDRAGNLYGTAYSGGETIDGFGTVYRLRRSGSNWIFDPLYIFLGGNDGAYPLARVVFGPDGVLYGTTYNGGSSNCIHGCGTVFSLRPPASACRSALCPWTETVLYRFLAGADGSYAGYGDLLFDQMGNIYGTTMNGGLPHSEGTAYEMTPAGSGWAESVLHSFSGSSGELPQNGVIFDNAGNLYGTTAGGGTSNCGAVYQLTYSAGNGWTENLLYSFQCGNDGFFPYPGLIFDSSGNLYGATTSGGAGGGGTVFELSPAGGSWSHSVLYSFLGDTGCGPYGTLVMDGAGNLYGTTHCDGAKKGGNVFKVTSSGGGWTYTSLHDFTGGNDGANPYSNVILDANGNLYGTTFYGGSNGAGVVWEITP